MPYKYKRAGSPYYWIGFTKKEMLLGAKSFSTKTPNRIKADEILRNVKKELHNSSLANIYSSEEKENILLSKAYQLFLRDRENSGNKLSNLTTESYTMAFKYFYKFVGDKIITDYVREDYHAFAESMKNISQNSRSVYTKRIYSLFNWLVKEEYLTKNPMKRIPEEIKPIKMIPKESIDILIDYARSTKFYWMVLFEIASAFRIHEVLNVRRKDIEENIIQVKGKGNKYSSIPIIKPMQILLNKMTLPEDPETRLFPFSDDAAWRFYSRFRKNTGIELRSHDCRKFTLSQMANSGIPINFTKEYARHSSITTTMKYYIANDKIKMTEEINKKLSLFESIKIGNRKENYLQNNLQCL